MELKRDVAGPAVRARFAGGSESVSAEVSEAARVGSWTMILLVLGPERLMSFWKGFLLLEELACGCI